MKVPAIGDYDDVPVIDVLVKVGDTVRAYAPFSPLRVRQGDDGCAPCRTTNSPLDQGLGLRLRRRWARRVPARGPRVFGPLNSRTLPALLVR